VRSPVEGDELAVRWLHDLIATRGLTAIREISEARRALVEDSLRGAELVRLYGGPVIDVGSGGGVPGIPLALALPDVEFTLLEPQERKVSFLRRWAAQVPNVQVVRGRAESQATDVYRVAVTKALAPPPVAAEWCLPLVEPGGAAILWVGPSAKAASVERVAGLLEAELDDSRPGFFVLRKRGPTPPGFPRRAGVARKRPLG
jgi:16S rRNA (guanine527-N7)-methyltransferase